MTRIITALLALGFNAWAIQPVFACGGTFCGAPPPMPVPPEPVDQTAERIVFEVNPGKITAHVQISYMGSADDFAWIVPVPSVPEVDESTAAFFDQMEMATRLDVLLPPDEPCDVAFASSGSDDGGGFGCGSSEAAFSNAGGGGAEAPRAPVEVLVHDYTENFEFVVVRADSTMDLVEWLSTNGYNIESNMTPVIDPYNGATAKFLALKLREGKQATDIVPIRMTYDADRPMIPLRLTAVAAQVHMGVLVMVLADVPFAPANYKVTRPNTNEIIFDANGRTSYFEWVARSAAENEGQLFVEEYLDTPPGIQIPGGGRSDYRFLSRFYTRISPEHMTVDPEFMPATDPERRTRNVLDFSASLSKRRCGTPIPERQPSQCAFTYCGLGSSCSIGSDGNAACGCPANTVAVSVMGPDGNRRPTCTPRVNQFGVTAAATGAGTPVDPCNSFNCGEGVCILRGGFPSCECPDGAVATVLGSTVRCEQASTGPTFGPGAGVESASNTRMGSLTSSSGRRRAGSGLWMAAALFGLSWAGRRIRRRRNRT